MPAHSTIDDALASVAAFSAASKQQLQVRKDKKMKVKDKDRKKEKDRHKSHHKHKKDKAKGRDDHADSDSGSDEYPAETLEEQLIRSRQAVRTTREILSAQPDLRDDLRELLKRVDAGQALDLAGIPDAHLQQRLRDLFQQLQLQRTRKGVFIKRPGATPVLDLLGGIIAEAPAELATPAVQPGHVKLQSSAAPQTATTDSKPSQSILTEALPAAGIFPANGLPLTNGSLAKPALPASGPPEGHTSGSTPSIINGGPSIGPQARPPDQGEQHDNGGSEAADGCTHGIQVALDHSEQLQDIAGPEQKCKVVAGPAIPPAELLAAAAEAAEQMAAEGDIDDLLVGPIPPDVGAQADAASGDERSAEVIRILRVMDSEGRGDATPSDAYAVLGIEAAATGPEVKKHFWRLSLLTHPDKCLHPQAHTAFDAVAQAAKALQDSQQRAVIDKKRQEAHDLKEAQAAAADEERARQWRIVQGKATAEDLAGPKAGPQPLERGAWMTEVPEERRPNAVPSQKSQTAFSSQGMQRRGDTSAWTDTPQQKLQRLQRSYEEQAAALPPAASERPVSEGMLQAVGDFNATHRGKSLLEQHQDRQKKQQKQERKERKRKAQAVGATAEDGSRAAWTGEHPWRPFDREKDMKPPSKAVSGSEMMRKSGALSDRFGS